MEDWFLGISLVSTLIIVLTLVFQRRRRENDQVEVWKKLAQRMNLEFSPSQISGQFRRRNLRISLPFIGTKSSPHPSENTLLYLSIDSYGYWFTIERNDTQDSKPGLTNISKGYGNIFDHYTIHGNPPELVQKIVRIILRADPSCRGWIMQNRPKIELKQGSLLCRQKVAIKDIATQIKFTNLLCDIAEFLERKPIR